MKSKLLKSTIVILLMITSFEAMSVKIMTWNIRDFGQRLSDIQIDSIAIQMNQADIVTIQEVVTNETGNQTAGKLLSSLKLLNPNWNYLISDATDSDKYKTEKYLIFWNASIVNISGSPWMEYHYGKEFQREPLMCSFKTKIGDFILVTIHSRSKKDNPEQELKYLKELPKLYDSPMIIVGDFNVEPSNSVFIPLKSMGFSIANTTCKTSLKTKYIKDQDPGSRIIDNGLISSQFQVEYVKTLSIADEAAFNFWHKVSDHRWLLISLN